MGRPSSVDFLILLAPFEEEPTTQLFLEAARRLKIVIRLSLPGDSTSKKNPGAPVLPRIGLRNPDESLARLEAMEAGGSIPLNPSRSIRVAKRKESLQELPQLGIGRPASAIWMPGAPPPLPFPFVAKRSTGARGEGVTLVRGAGEWESLTPQSPGPLVIEEFFPPSARREWRILVLGGHAIASTERFPAPGEFRANRARGGTETAGIPDRRFVALAERTAIAWNLGLTAIDLIEPAGRPPVVVDVNDTPGLAGISETLNRDLASEVLEGWP